MSKPKQRRMFQIRAHPELMELRKLPYHEAHKLHRDTLLSALNSTPRHERDILERHVGQLAHTFKGLGKMGALELLAALGIALNDAEEAK